MYGICVSLLLQHAMCNQWRSMEVVSKRERFVNEDEINSFYIL